MTDYEKQAVDFLKNSGATMKIEYVGTVDGFPFDDNDTLPHRKYKVTIERDGETYKFPFYGSYRDWQKDEDPSEYDVLACLQKYDVGDMADFVDEFGYEIKDRKSFLRVEKIWKSCKAEYKALLRVFGYDLFEELREIS